MKKMILKLTLILLFSTPPLAEAVQDYKSLPSGGNRGGGIPGRKTGPTDPKNEEAGWVCGGENCNGAELGRGITGRSNPASSSESQQGSSTQESGGGD